MLNRTSLVLYQPLSAINVEFLIIKINIRAQRLLPPLSRIVVSAMFPPRLRIV